MEILIKLKKGIDTFPQNFGIDKVVANRVITDIVKVKNHKGLLYSLSIKNKHLMDLNEFHVYKIIQKNPDINVLEIVRFSRSFIDLHKVEERFPEMFKEALGRIRSKEKTKGFYIHKEKNSWWIGVKNIAPSNKFDPLILVIKILTVGCGLGFVPSDFLLKKDNYYISDLNFI